MHGWEWVASIFAFIILIIRGLFEQEEKDVNDG